MDVSDRMFPMPLSNHKFREIVLQLLFSHDFSQLDEKETAAMLMQQLAVPHSALRNAQARVEKVAALFPELDRQVAALAHDYEYNRIPRMERAILRLGLFELAHDPEIPPKVAIAEAIRLARKFVTPEASAFVNAVLDKALSEKISSSNEHSDALNFQQASQ